MWESSSLEAQSRNGIITDKYRVKLTEKVSRKVECKLA